MFKYTYLYCLNLGLLLIVIGLLACSGEPKKQENQPVINPQVMRESLEKVNRKLVLEEAEAIDAYAKRHGLQMIKTGTGLQFIVFSHGNGDSIRKGDVVRFKYVTKLLSGDIIYSSETAGPKQFVVGRGGVEAGLEEAVLHLKRGDAAIIILPSHLAFGLLGDQDMIPPRSTVIYEIEIIDNQ
ncbi:MAG: FKBP-type peptidyl-prolyl cis-trans isomerase [Bacteroidales bacterium]|nr:FKBP-type peptidyl-prolyl cis-trans isomerase [Bacteroidales bacterium]